MAHFTFDQDTVSDLHKDVFGFRPDQEWWTVWRSANDTLDEFFEKGDY